MKIKVSSLKDSSVPKNEIEVLVKSSVISKDVNEIIEYIEQFPNKTSRRIVVNSDGIIKEIKIDDIICFYSDKKYNYCRTKEKSYKIKSKLYEIEKMDPNFIRISKACIVNSKHIKFFNLNETGRIVVVFNDDSEEVVSRRKVKSIMEFLDERSI